MRSACSATTAASCSRTRRSCAACCAKSRIWCESSRFPSDLRERRWARLGQRRSASMQLNEVRPQRGATRKRKRIGRGPGSGHGGTATKGHKGHQARAGGGKTKGFEGGQMPLTRRIPKFGFKNPFRVEYQVINVGLLQERFQDGGSVDAAALYGMGVLQRKYAPVKLLGGGDLAKRL